MRKLLLLTGLLLLPLGAHAAVDCEQLKHVEPISQHYVKNVLERADAGIRYAAEAKTNTDFFPLYFGDWTRQVAATFARLIDSKQRLTLRSADLPSTTACLRFDQILIECKMDAVRRALDQELERGSFIAIMRLQSTMNFLQARLYHLSQGSLDGSYADETWDDFYLFDEEPVEELTEPLCPFHSNYTPPRMTGYGCDISILDTINGNGLDFAQAERDGLAKIEKEIDAFREIIPLLGEATVGQFPEHTGFDGSQEFDNDSVSDREHHTIIGCQEEEGLCSEDDGLKCGSNEFCASKGKGQCIRNTTTPTIPKRSIRGTFSYTTDHLRLLSDFLEKRIEDGFSRTFPAEWARYEDLPPDSDELKQREHDEILLGTTRSSFRLTFRSISGIQGRKEGAIFPEAADSQLEIADALSDMRASIGELSRLASLKQGVRTFVLELAYFLRRTCAFRACGKILEQVVRIGLQDECFPYTNGSFLSDTEDSPRWKKCAEAACIQVDGASLNGSCFEILP